MSTEQIPPAVVAVIGFLLGFMAVCIGFVVWVWVR